MEPPVQNLPGNPQSPKTVPGATVASSKESLLDKLAGAGLTLNLLIVFVIAGAVILLMFFKGFSLIKEAGVKIAGREANKYSQFVTGGRVESSAGKNKRFNGGKETDLRAGNIVKQGDELVIENSGSLVVIFDSGATMALAGGSEMVLLKLDKDEIIVSQKQGSVFYQSAKGISLIVKSAGLVTEAPDPASFIISASLSSAALSVNEGRLKVKSQEAGETVEIAAGNMREPGGNVVLLEADKMILTANEFLSGKMQSGTSASQTTSPPEGSGNSKNISLELSYTNTNGRLDFVWILTGAEKPYDGFRIFQYDLSPDGAGPLSYEIGAGLSNYSLNPSKGKVYIYKVCALTAGNCVVTSNSLEVYLP